MIFHRFYFPEIKPLCSFHVREITPYFLLFMGKIFFPQGTHNKTDNVIIKTFDYCLLLHLVFQVYHTLIKWSLLLILSVRNSGTKG